VPHLGLRRQRATRTAQCRETQDNNKHRPLSVYRAPYYNQRYCLPRTYTHTPTHRQLPATRGANPRLLLRFSPPPSKRQGCFSCAASIHVACHPEHLPRTRPTLRALSNLLNLPTPSAHPLNEEQPVHAVTHTRSPPRRPHPRCSSITPPLQGLLGDNHLSACASGAASQLHNTHLILSVPYSERTQQPATLATRAQTPSRLPHLGPLPASITRLRG
jgi:hypothetical protein